MGSNLFNLNTFDWIKGAIIAILVAVLTYIQQLLTEGSQISIKAIGITAITSLIGYMIKQLMTDESGAILSMVGGRKKRKKPKSKNNDDYEFDDEGEENFTQGMPVNVYSDLINGDLVYVTSALTNNGSQYVQFSQPIQYNDFETLYFEIEIN